MPAQTWLYGASGDWSNAADWVSGTVPGPSDDVIVNSYGQAISVTVSQPESAGSLTVINQAITGNGSLTIGSALTLDSASIAGTGNIAAGSLTIDSGSITGAGDVSVGADLSLSNGSITGTGDVSVGADLSLYSASITGTGSLSVSGDATLSYASVSFGSETFNGSVTLDNGSGIASTGSLIVNGAVSGSNEGGPSYLTSYGGNISLGAGATFYDYGGGITSINLYNGASLTANGALIFNEDGRYGSTTEINIQGGTITVSSGITDSSGTISGWGQINGNVSGFWVNDYQDTLTISGTCQGDGASIASGAALNIGGAFEGGWASLASGATLAIGGAFEGSSASLASGATLDIGGASNSSIGFGGPDDVLTLGDAAAFTGSISNMSLGDSIDLAGIAVSGVSYDGTNLTVVEANGQQFSFAVSGSNLLGTSPEFQSDGSGGTDVQWVQQGVAWLYGASGDWSNAADWVSGTVPGPSDDVIVNSYGQAISVTVSQPESAGSLTVINQAITGNGSLTIGSALTLDSASIAGTGNIAAGSLTIDSGSITGAGDVSVGADLSLSNGSITGTGDVSVGADLSLYSASITGTGSLSVSGDATLSYASVSFGSETFNGSVTLDNGSGIASTGSLIVNGAVSGSNEGGPSYLTSYGGNISLGAGATFYDYGGGITSINLYNGASLTANGALIFNEDGRYGSTTEINIQGGTITVSSGITDSSGTISGWGQINGNVSGFWVNDYQDTLTISGTCQGDGASIASGAALNIGGAFEGGWASLASGATLAIGGAFEGSSASLASGATLDIGGASNSSIGFGGPDDVLTLGDAAAFTGSISNMSLGDSIDLAGIAVSGVSYDGTNLTVVEANGQQFSFAVSGSNLLGTSPEFQSDGSGGTDVQWVQTPLAVSSLSVSTDNGATALNAGHVVTLTLGTTEPAFVTGTPSLLLNNGGEAVYTSGSGTDSLTFTYTVRAGQDTPDLLTKALAGGTISDQAGHPLGGLTDQDLRLRIDTVAPTVAITSAGGLTNDPALTVTGTASAAQGEAPVAGTTVTLFDNGTLAGTAQVQANGSWSGSVTLREGSNALTASDTDTAGNTGTSSAVTYTLDAENLAMFAGYDASGNDGLWVSNGAAAGTYELTGIAGASTTDFDPLDFINFNGEVLFDGVDSSGNRGLWVTSGTAAGTYELTGIAGASTGPDGTTPKGLAVAGLLPYGLTIFNGEVLFGGIDSSGNFGLWVTSGTAAGTHELTGIVGADTTLYSNVGFIGLQPYVLTVLNGEVLFGGVDAGGNYGLWVTNGTAAGTYELTGIAGANPSSGNGAGLNPNSNFVVCNDEVLFQGEDASGNWGLWASNGTVAGTYELSGITGAAPWGINPSDLTLFNGEVLFSGQNASFQQGLWVTNGTAAGTVELTGNAGVNSGGLNPSNLTVLGGEVLFKGEDASGDYGLWVTNGTAAGTYELTGIAGASAGGLDPSNIVPLANDTLPFAALNGEVEFNGTDASGNVGLWVSNGTVAGTYELGGIAGAAVALHPVGGLTYNGEMVFENQDGNGSYSLWKTNGTATGTQEIASLTGGPTGAVNFSLLNQGFNNIAAAVVNDEGVFTGADSAGLMGLWVTNGTAEGTYELTGIAGASTTLNLSEGVMGLAAHSFAAVDGMLVFAGTDSSGDNGLWVTNGTAAGTYELTGIAGAWTGARPGSAPGLLPAGLIAFNGEALFSGVDTTGNWGLWVTNGTAAGTQELISKLNFNDPVVLNGEVLFAGGPGGGLWETDGTAAGTHVIFPVPGVSGLTAYNGEAIFAANSGLWVTNGTAAGTSKITGISGASTGTNADGTSGFNPSDFTAFNGEVVFTAYDSNGQKGLWVANATAHTITEISGTSGIDAAGLAVYGNEVLFTGVNAQTGMPDGIWVTNGTAAGTYEIPGSSGLSPSSIAAVIVSTQAAPTIADAAITTGSDGNAYLNAANFGNGSTVLIGTSAAGDTVTVSDGTSIYTATVDASGNWNATVTGLLDGQTYTYIATATDGSGNAIPSQPLTFTVDTSTSESAISDAAVTGGSDGKLYIDGANFTNGATSLTGTAAAGDTVTVSDGANIYKATVDASGNWIAIVTGLVDGTAYTYTATATDPAGNTATSPAFTFTVDTATSVSVIDDVAVTTGTDGKSYIDAANFNGGTTTLTGSATPGDTVTVSDGTSAYGAAVDASGNWSATLAGLTGGQTYTYTATATDAAGNTATSQPFAFTVKTATNESAIADAVVTIGTDGNPYINAAAFNGGTTTLTGTAEAGDTVVVSDGTSSHGATVDASGNWTAALSGLTDGTSYSCTATATDAAGNTATSQPFGFAVDTSTSEGAIADAAVTIGTDGKPYINATNFHGGTTTLTGSATPGDTVTVSDGTNSYNATVDASGNWTAAIEGLVSGQSYSCTATATDAAGNTAASQPLVFTVKTATSESAIADAAVTFGTDGNPYIDAANFGHRTK